MSKDAIRAFLKNAVLEVKPDAATAEDPADFEAQHLIEDLGLDSLDVINLLFSLEEEFGVKIPEPDIDAHDLYRVGALTGYVSERL
jgi:acyl carrier protein